MKNPKINTLNKNKIFKYKLLKTKIYKNNLEICMNLKKYIGIIYKYQMLNKKILIINTSTDVTQKLLKLISRNNNLFLTNYIFKNKIMLKNYFNTKILNKQKFLNNKIHLIIILNDFKYNSNFSLISDIKKPSLFLNFKDSNQSNTKLKNGFELLDQKIHDNLIYTLLNKTLTKKNKNF